MRWYEAIKKSAVDVEKSFKGKTTQKEKNGLEDVKMGPEMEVLEPLEDVINKPSHYHQNGIDVIGFSELQFPKDELKGFYRINILKYVTRYDRKNNLEDLKKANFYLTKLIELESGS